NLGILVGDGASGTTMQGGITNSGTISASVFNAGILVLSGSAIQGGITNTGDLTGVTAAIDVRGERAATTINQRAGTIRGDILRSTTGLNDTVNVTGGTINGNIVGQGAGTVNFAPGAGNTFTYAASFGFSNVNQVNVNSGTVLLNGDNNSANAVAVNSGGT